VPRFVTLCDHFQSCYNFIGLRTISKEANVLNKNTSIKTTYLRRTAIYFMYLKFRLLIFYLTCSIAEVIVK